MSRSKIPKERENKMKNVMKHKDYLNLPWVSVADLRLLFVQAITDLKKDCVTKKEFFDILDELTMRQVDSYEILKNPVKAELDSVLCGLWNTESYDDVDRITSFIINLGLEKTYNRMLKSISSNDNIPPEIVAEIEDTIKEVGENVFDPFHDYMRRTNELDD